MKRTGIKLFLQVVLLLAVTLAVQAAPVKDIAGKVTDEKGEGLPGVTVLIKGTTVGTTTDADGNFTLASPADNGTLIVSFIGYVTKEVPITNTDTYKIALLVDAKALQEVVVVGYGEQKRANVLGAVATVKAADIEDLPAANLAQTLVNRVPGVGVGSTSGKPGAITSIRIRNPSVFAASSTTEPLYVIDGFQLTREDFDNLDATQVETITFLKDAAASIYGSRGANGVVLVTTKKGKPGKAKISYQGSHGISDATRFSDMLSGYDHASLLNGLNLSNNAPATTLYTEEELEYLKTHRYNWLDEVWQGAQVSRHTLNISGGSENVTYFAGGNYYNETGNLRDLYVQKYGLRFGMNAKITEGLNASVTLSTDNSTMNRPSPKGVTVQSETLSETVGSLLLMPEWVPMYIDGKPVYSATPGWHPYELQNSGSYARTKSQGITLNANIEYKVPAIPGLSVRVMYGRNTRTNFGKEYYASYNLYDFVRQGTHTGGTQNVIFTNQLLASNGTRVIKNGNLLSEGYGGTSNYQLNESVSYSRRFGNHDINIFAAAEQSETAGDEFKTSREGQVIPDMDQLFAFTTDKSLWDNSGSSSEGGRMSYLGRLNYSFRDRYLLESTFRADASPNFPPGADWGYFPSVAVGWKISEENFFRNNVTFVDNLKVRFQVGLTGNDAIAAFQYKTRYTQTTGMLFGSTQTSGLNNNNTPNSQITWEKALYKNLGIDGALFNGKFNFALDFYHRYNYDMFDSPTATVPTTFGGTISPQNYGRLVTYGIEAGLGYNGTIGKDFSYSLGINTGRGDNRVIRRYISDNDAGTWRDTNGRRTDNGIEGYKSIGMLRTQEDLDAFLAQNPKYTIDGQKPKLGWLLFEDISGDGIITDADKTRLKTRTGGGFGMGHNLGLSYKGLRLNVNLNWGVGGYDVYDKPARTVPNNNQSALAHWRDAYSVNNITGAYPALDARYAAEIHDMWITSASYMRVNNMNISYALPTDLMNRLKLPQIRVFATGTNLWDIVNNQPYKYSTTNVSTDYPAMRNYSFGLNVSL